MGNLMNEKDLHTTIHTIYIMYRCCFLFKRKPKHVTIRGTILEEDTQLPIGQATIQLLSLPTVIM